MQLFRVIEPQTRRSHFFLRETRQEENKKCLFLFSVCEEMDGVEGQSLGSAAAARYTLPPVNYSSEDILFCIDVGPESLVEMKVTGPNGRPFTRLDSMKQAILFFIHAKLTINPDHRFAFTSLGKSVSWVRSSN